MICVIHVHTDDHMHLVPNILVSFKFRGRVVVGGLGAMLLLYDWPIDTPLQGFRW